MLRGLSGNLEAKGRARVAAWVSMSTESASLKWGARSLEFVSLPPEEQQQYAAAKAALWEEIHGLRSEAADAGEVAGGLKLLGRAIGARCRALHEERPFDLFYTHDFQLLELGAELPRGVPRVFRWHVPVRPMPQAMRSYVARALDEYDAVIVSTQAYAEELHRWGVRAPVHASYPYLDESRRRVVTQTDVDAFDARFALKGDDVVFTLVARMDPMKSHDVAIRALARIAEREPRAKLVLVGGGGFSGGRQGLGLPHAGAWRESLTRLALELGVADRVVFTGGLTDEELDVAVTRSRAILLPSVLEGFGLAAIEGWLYGKPVLVSRGAGVAELVEEGMNGYTFEPGDDATLASAMLRLARDAEEAQLLGEEGRRTARVCHLDRGASDVWSILRGVLDARRDRVPSWRRRW
ncbi:MAG TPA: glycosyltransferase family 4 protein [Candidatus Thermoplasmatota archaeon]|nr:glycosyltransferase family 4 protein [Candidatus Thermoplasmatota archaeon]